MASCALALAALATGCGGAGDADARLSGCDGGARAQQGGGGAGGQGGASGGCRGAEGCDDGDACTLDACDHGACAHGPVAIDDGDACTADSCDAAAGVLHTPLSTDDDDVCTVDSCDPLVGVLHTPRDVDDGDACTADSCDPASGAALHALLPGCCPHSACEEGAALSDACSYAGAYNDCVAKVCEDDAYCCVHAWDALCVAHARDPAICPTGLGAGKFSCACGHGYCVTGAALSKGCDPCVKKICEGDPACCASGWDAICVAEVAIECNVPPGADCQ